MKCHFRFCLFVVVAVIATAGISAAKTITLNFSGKYYQGSNHATTGSFAGSLSFDNTTGVVSAITLSRDGGLYPSTANCPSLCTTSLNYKPPLINFQASSGFNGSFFITATSLVGITTLTPAPNPNMGNAYGDFSTPSGDPICGNGSGCGITTLTFTPRH
jgi:hypothetical protein